MKGHGEALKIDGEALKRDGETYYTSSYFVSYFYIFDVGIDLSSLKMILDHQNNIINGFFSVKIARRRCITHACLGPLHLEIRLVYIITDFKNPNLKRKMMPHWRKIIIKKKIVWIIVLGILAFLYEIEIT